MERAAVGCSRRGSTSGGDGRADSVREGRGGRMGMLLDWLTAFSLPVRASIRLLSWNAMTRTRLRDGGGVGGNMSWKHNKKIGNSHHIDRCMHVDHSDATRRLPQPRRLGFSVQNAVELYLLTAIDSACAHQQLTLVEVHASSERDDSKRPRWTTTTYFGEYTKRSFTRGFGWFGKNRVPASLQSNFPYRLLQKWHWVERRGACVVSYFPPKRGTASPNIVRLSFGDTF